MSRFVTLAFILGAAMTARAGSPTAAKIPISNFEFPISDVFNDSIPPTITCPPNVTLTLESSNCDTVYSYTVTAEDDQPGVLFALVTGIESGQSFPAGVTTNLFLAIDEAGNTASCSFTVTVDPANGPGAISCKDVVVLELGANCSVEMHPFDMLIPPYGCSVDYSTEVDKTAPFGNGPWVPAVFGAADINKTYQARVRNLVNNNTCWGNITIADSLPPALQCPEVNVPCTLPLAHLTPDFLHDSLGITGGRPIVLENCPGNANLFFTDVSTNLPCDSPGNVTGFIRRFWTALDASNNAATCVQTINRIRSLDDVQYPADTTVSCANPQTGPSHTGGPFIQVGSWTYSLLTAPFCEIDAFYSDSISPLCGGSYRIHRTWSVMDACRPNSTGNPVYGTQLIDVMDQDGPVFQCLADTTVTIAPQNCQITLNLPDLVVGDACSTVEQVQAFWTANDLNHETGGSLEDFSGNDPANSDTLAVFGAVTGLPTGINNILYIATDVCGNTASCEVMVQVWDSTAPLAVCDTFLKVFLDDQGQAVMSAEFPDAGSSDDCGEIQFKIRRGLAGACDNPGLTFDANVPFCCADAGDTLTVVMRVYDVLVPAGAVADTFATGQFADCTAQVEVLDTNPPDCTPPANVTVSCDAFDPALDYGGITLSCKADSVSVSVNYTQFDTVCGRGTITRVFRVFDTSDGNSGQCTQRVVVEYEQNYFIRFPDDLIVFECDTANFYGEPELTGLDCENMNVTFEDELFTVVPDACFKIERTWTITNACTHDPAQALITVPNPSPLSMVNHPDNFPGPVVSAPGAADPWASTVVKINPTDPQPTDYSLFWSADANGYQYKQIIKIIDLAAPEFENCPAGPVSVSDQTVNDAQFWNETYWWNASTSSHDLCESPVELCIDGTDLCSGNDLDFAYLLFLDLDGDGSQETVVNSDNLPGFNNVNFNNSLNPNYGGGQPRAFDERPVPANQKYGFALQTFAAGNTRTACVRWNTQQAPLDYQTPLLPHGTHRIKWFVVDGCGNENSCEYEFTIIDGNDACMPTEVTVSGSIKTEAGAGVSNVAVVLDGLTEDQQPFNLFALTDANGYYEFTINTGDSYTITPVRDDDPLNGVSTLDMLLINKHILGIDPLPSPYKLVAADANGSRSATTFDIVEIRKLILGINTQFPNNTSWRFVDAEYQFPNPANPFQEIFPEMTSGQNILPGSPPIVHDFIGIKTADVNGNAIPNAQAPQPEDRAAALVTLNDVLLQAGETRRIALRWSEASRLEGLQFALQFDPQQLAVRALDAGRHVGARGPLAQYYAQPAPGLLTFSWDDLSAPAFSAGEPLIYLQVEALQTLQLSAVLRLHNAVLRAEAYPAGAAPLPLGLAFTGSAKPSLTEIFPPQPNPATDGPVYIPVTMAEAAILRVELYDLSGRQIWVQENEWPTGLHRVEIPTATLKPGVLAYRVQAGTATASGKIMVKH